MIAGGASLAPRRWSLVAEATDDPQQAAVLVHRADDRGAEHEELGVVVRGVAGDAAGCPRSALPSEKLTCLPEPLTPGERLLVEQALHAVLLGDRLEGRHQQLLVVGGHVGPLEHRRDLELAGRDLVVPGLGRDAELEQLALGVHHEAEHPLGDGAEVVVVELLALRRLGAEQRAAGVEQVGPGQEEVPVDQEVLLLGAAEGHHVLRVVVAEQLAARARRASPIACCERSSGVLWSSASPVIETKTVGMHSVLPFGFSRMYAGLVTSQPV